MTGLTPGATYYFKAMSTADANGAYAASDWSEPTSATLPVVLNAPAIAFGAVDAWTINFTVNPVDHATSYVYRYSTDSSFANATEVSVAELGAFNIADLQPGETYYFQAAAIGDGVRYLDSSWSETFSTSTPKVDLLAPPVSIQTVGSTTLSFSFESVANASSYEYRYATTQDGLETATAISASAAGTFELTGLSPATTYYVQVRAIGNNTNYVTSEWSTAVDATTVKIVLDAPEVDATTVDSSTITFEIGAVENADFYEYEYSTSRYFTAETTTSGTATSAGAFDVSGLQPFTTYYFRAKAVVDAESPQAETHESSAWSTEASATTAKAALPAPAISAVALDPTTLALTIDPVVNAAGYAYLMSTDPTFADAEPVASGSGTIALTGLTPGATYYFKAMATADANDPYNNSAWSAPTSEKMQIVLDAPAITPVATGASTIDFAIAPVDDATAYVYRYATSEEGLASAESIVVSAAEVASGAISLSGLNPFTTYYFEAYAVGDGAGYLNSDWSEPKSATTKPQTPGAITFTQYPGGPAGEPVQLDGTWLRVRWDYCENKPEYILYYREAGATEWTAMDVAAETKEVTAGPYMYDLTPGVEYEFYAVAVDPNDANNVSEASEIKTFRMMTAPVVEAPVFNETTGRVEFAWTADEDSSKYRVEFSTVPFEATGVSSDDNTRVYVLGADDTSIDFGSLEAGQTYYFRVRSHNVNSGGGTSAWSYMTWTPDAIVAPNDLTFTQYLTAEGEDWVRVRWTDVKGETGYRVEYRAVGETEWSVAEETKANAALGALYDLTPGTTYEYRVVALRGEETAISEVSSFTLLDAPAINAPVYNASTGRVTFSWNEAEAVDKYRVEFSTVPFGEEGGEVRTYVLDGAATSKDFGSLEPGQTYYFRVRAHQASGSGNSAWAYSSWTPEALTAPSGLSFTQYVSDGESWVRVRWSDGERETGYRVEYRAVGETEWNVGDETQADATVGAFYNLAPGTTYEYRVVAVRGAETAVSEVATFALLAKPTVETPIFDASTGRVAFSWSDVDNADKYRVEFSSVPFVSGNVSSGDAVRVYIHGQGSTSRDYGVLEAGKTYYFRVRAYQANGAGNSAWSDVVEFAVPAAANDVSNAFADFFAEAEGEDDFWFEFEKALGERSK